MEYHDLDIILFPGGERGMVRLARCGTRHGEGVETVPLDVDALAEAAHRLDDAGAGVDPATQRTLGLTLYRGLLGDGDVGRQLDRCLDGARTQENAGVRVRLNLDQVPSLAPIPWELVSRREDGSARRLLRNDSLRRVGLLIPRVRMGAGGLRRQSAAKARFSAAPPSG